MSGVSTAVMERSTGLDAMSGIAATRTATRPDL
jgi:hypothetical protein